MNKNNWLWSGVVVLVMIIILALSFDSAKDDSKTENKLIKIGIVTDLTGQAGYWGESTRAGAELAKTELAEEGYKVELVFEDYQLDPAKALTAAQKLINADQVDAIYAEFNPAAITISSFLKEQKPILFVYDAAPESPLQTSPYVYKSYLDFHKGCHELAQTFRDQGIDKIGLLKLNWETTDICIKGLEEVYQKDKIVTEAYNFGDADVHTQVLKLKNQNVGAVVNVTLPAETLTSLKAIKDINWSVPYGTETDAIIPDIEKIYAKELKDAEIFGFKPVDASFVQKLDKDLISYEGAALAYTHIKQMAKAIGQCDQDMDCVVKKMDSSPASSAISFNRFINHIANFDLVVNKHQ
ncbi:MAG: ABC transporter substrate-binding protein [Patescibacteria group bacterium]|jgi:ABC-type branched-subunit amino acid transport system substrate-binding protein